MRKIIPILVCLVLCSACSSSSLYVPEFLTDNTLRLEIHKKSIFVYDPLTCQYSYNTERKEFRVFTDNMSDYYYLRLEDIPTQEETLVQALELSWTSPNGSNQTRTNIELEVVKLEDNTIWLWYQPEGIKITVAF